MSATTDVWSRSVMAPTGQCSEHWPQLMHSVSAMGTPNGVETPVRPARESVPKMLMSCSSEHARTQRWHKMHFSMSNSSELEDSSLTMCGLRGFLPANSRSSTWYRCTASCSSHRPLALHVMHAFG